MSSDDSAAPNDKDGDDKIRIGVSTCLLGEKVRFDGGHKHDSFLTGTLARFVEFVPVCPEVEMGMGTPREAIRLVRPVKGGEIHLVGGKTSTDHTQGMLAWSRRRVPELEKLDLSGYILKSKSPSCGLFRVPIYDHNNMPEKKGRGLFAEVLTAELPYLPVEEDGRLNDPRLRENFYERVFAYRRVENLFRSRWKLGDLVRFHAREKMFLLAHDRKNYNELGRLVADGKSLPRKELAVRYRKTYQTCVEKLATTGKVTNVLQHMAGHFKKQLDPIDRQELAQVIHDYRSELVPLSVPLTLIRHYTRRLDVEYLQGQSFLEPHPKELMLRNHV